ncbi:hypothetical protein V6Z11_A07G169000 [Gossypium hirsutum]
MCYNGWDKGLRSHEGELTPKIHSQFRLQAVTCPHEARIVSNRQPAIQRVIYFSCSNRGLKPLLRRIDGAILVRSNVDRTFYSLMGFGRSRGTTTAYLFSIIHASPISVWVAISRAHHLTMYLYKLRTTRSPLSFWIDRGIIPFEPFFNAFLESLEKAAINRIFLILHSQKEEH